MNETADLNDSTVTLFYSFVLFTERKIAVWVVIVCVVFVY